MFARLMCWASRPLSVAALQLGIPVLSVDLLLDSSHDLRDDSFYEQLLRLAFSGGVAFAAAGPPCKDYSRLRLLPGGPAPLRTIEYPQGLPDLSAAQQIQLRQSQQLLSQPWSSRLLLSAGRSLRYKLSWHLLYKFAALPRPAATGWTLRSLGCLLPLLSRSVLWGADAPMATGPTSPFAASGMTRDTFSAKYPPLLASLYVQQVSVLFDTKSPGTDLDLTLPRLLSAIPAKALDARPLAVQDGGGLCSQPDWSVPRSATVDPLGGLRKSILSFITDKSFPRRLLEHVSSGHDCPIFTDAEISDLRGIVEAWFRQQGWHTDVGWSVEAHQPYCLHALHALSMVIQDPDISLFPCLIEGVPTSIGIDEADVAPLICLDNWASAEAEPRAGAFRGCRRMAF